MNTDQRTDAELNRIIHRWIGYVPSEPLNEGQIFTYGYRPDNSWGEIAITDYCTDLNAIREAEKKWCAQQAPEDAAHPRYKLAAALYNFVPAGEQPCFAGARQRAEALVAVIQAS